MDMLHFFAHCLGGPDAHVNRKTHVDELDDDFSYEHSINYFVGEDEFVWWFPDYPLHGAALVNTDEAPDRIIRHESAKYRIAAGFVGYVDMDHEFSSEDVAAVRALYPQIPRGRPLTDDDYSALEALGRRAAKQMETAHE